MWLPKPITLLRIVCLKPRTTQTDTIITARPIAMPSVAIRMAGLDTFLPRSSLPFIFRAINKGKFICLYSIVFCLLNDCKDRTFFPFNGIYNIPNQTFLLLLHFSINDMVLSLRLRFREPDK